MKVTRITNIFGELCAAPRGYAYKLISSNDAGFQTFVLTRDRFRMSRRKRSRYSNEDHSIKNIDAKLKELDTRISALEKYYGISN